MKLSVSSDKFYPKGISISDDNYKLQIFDRWGELIWESNSKNVHWDGTANGGSEIVPNGTYIWKVITEEETLSKEQHEYMGHVTVIN